MQTKVGRCLVTIIANGGETSLNQDNLRLIPSFLILIFLLLMIRDYRLVARGRFSDRLHSKIHVSFFERPRATKR